MKSEWRHLDKYRVLDGKFRSPLGATFGAFSIKHEGTQLNIIASDGRMDTAGAMSGAVPSEEVGLHQRARARAAPVAADEDAHSHAA